MTARATMGTIITYIRGLIGDTSGTATQKFTDDNIQTAVDVYQEYVAREELTKYETPTASGYEYRHYKSRPYFEGGGSITTPLYEAADPDTLDYFNGQYTYTAAQAPTIDRYITGYRYDVHAAAADLADQWIASIKMSAIDFKAGSSSFTQSQAIQNLTNLAAALRRKSERGTTNTVILQRGDC